MGDPRGRVTPSRPFTVTPPLHTDSMARNQLTLLATTSVWHLDQRTREVGRRGVAAAREVLAEARRRDLADTPDDHATAA